MSVPLVEALQRVDLQSGQTYRCRVKGLLVELRVFDPAEPPPAPLAEADVMLDPWTELPEPGPGVVGSSQPGEPDFPDIPDMPPAEERA
jgi:hypothetical protein